MSGPSERLHIDKVNEMAAVATEHPDRAFGILQQILAPQIEVTLGDGSVELQPQYLVVSGPSSRNGRERGPLMTFMDLAPDGSVRSDHRAQRPYVVDNTGGTVYGVRAEGSPFRGLWSTISGPNVWDSRITQGGMGLDERYSHGIGGWHYEHRRENLRVVRAGLDWLRKHSEGQVGAADIMVNDGSWRRLQTPGISPDSFISLARGGHETVATIGSVPARALLALPVVGTNVRIVQYAYELGTGEPINLVR